MAASIEGPCIGEAAEEGRPPVEAEFSGKILIRGGEAEVDEQQGPQGVIRWDERGYPEIYKAELSCLSHNSLVLRPVKWVVTP